MADEDEVKWTVHSIHASIFPCLLVHQNSNPAAPQAGDAEAEVAGARDAEPPAAPEAGDAEANDPDDALEQIEPYNPILNIRVNQRHAVRPVILSGLLRYTLNLRQPLGELLSSYYHVVLATIVDNDGGEGDSVQVHSTLTNVTEGGLLARGTTREDLINALRWLLGAGFDEGEINALDKPHLIEKYLHELHEGNIPNASGEDLLTFVRDREWTSPSLWGGERDTFIERVNEYEDYPDRQRRMLCRYIQWNMARVTGIGVFLVDHLHMGAALDGILTGMCPAEIDDEIAQRTRQTHQSFNEQSLVGQDFLLNLRFTSPNRINTNVLSVMQDESARLQSASDLATNHSVIQMLSTIGAEFMEELSRKLGDNHGRHFYDTNGRNRGVVRILDGVDMENGSYRDPYSRITEGLFATEADHEEFLNSFGWQSIDQSHDFSLLATRYLQARTMATLRVLHTMLRRMIDEERTTLQIDELVCLRSVGEMDEDQFQHMFMTNTARTYGNVTADQFRLDPDQSPLELYLVQNYNRGARNATNIISGEAYHKPRATGGRGQIFDSCLIDFVRFLVYMSLSPGCEQALLDLLNENPDIDQIEAGPGADRNVRDNARHMLRCMMLNISSVALYSTFYWYRAGTTFFLTTATGQRPCNATKYLRMFYSLMSAVVETATFFTRMGTHPQFPAQSPHLTAHFTEWAANSSLGALASRNYVVLITLAFHIYLRERFNDDNDGNTRNHINQLDASIARDLGIDYRDLDFSVRVDLRSTPERWMGAHTRGGPQTLCLEPNDDLQRRITSNFPRDRPLVQVPHHLRIGEFCETSFPGKDFFHHLANDTTATNNDRNNDGQPDKEAGSSSEDSSEDDGNVDKNKDKGEGKSKDTRSTQGRRTQAASGKKKSKQSNKGRISGRKKAGKKPLDRKKKRLVELQNMSATKLNPIADRMRDVNLDDLGQMISHLTDGDPVKNCAVMGLQYLKMRHKQLEGRVDLGDELLSELPHNGENPYIDNMADASDNSGSARDDSNVQNQYDLTDAFIDDQPITPEPPHDPAIRLFAELGPGKQLRTPEDATVGRGNS